MCVYDCSLSSHSDRSLICKYTSLLYQYVSFVYIYVSFVYQYVSFACVYVSFVHMCDNSLSDNSNESGVCTPFVYVYTYFLYIYVFAEYGVGWLRLVGSLKI